MSGSECEPQDRCVSEKRALEERQKSDSSLPRSRSVVDHCHPFSQKRARPQSGRNLVFPCSQNSCAFGSSNSCDFVDRLLRSHKRTIHETTRIDTNEADATALRFIISTTLRPTTHLTIK